MKIYSSLAILALLLLCACGSENIDSDTDMRPVDTWSPFVQVLPPGNIWDVQTHEPEVSSPSPAHLARQERIAYEIYRLYNFFGHGPTLGGWISGLIYPDYFGGFGWYDDLYMIVLIVESKEDEAAEFLAYLEDFETIQIRSSRHSFNELVLVQNVIWNSNVYPVLWWSRINTMTSSVVVYLFSYTDKEKAFFREFVTDSPLIDFACMVETHGEFAMVSYLSNPHLPVNQLEGVTMSAFARYTHFYVIAINKEPGLTTMVAYYCILETYMDGRWIPVYERSLLGSPTIDLLESGTSYFEISTEHFTRHFDGPFRMNVYIEQSHPWRRHRLTYNFSHGG